MKSSSFLSKKRAAIKWIENVLECKIETNKDFIETLQDGVLICKVMQTISPRLMPRISIPDPNTPQRTILFKYSENVSFFIQACTDMGVPRHKRFALSDLVHSSNSSPSYTNMKRIIECLESVSKIANSDPQYEFSIEWPEIDQEEFSEEEIHQAEKLLAQFTIRESKRQEVIKKSQSNDVPSVEATKNQLFQHMAAQKQLYPDNSPQKSPKLDGVSNRNSLSSPIKLNPIFTAGANSTPTTTTTTTTTTNTTSSNTASVAPIPSNNSTSITSTTATVTPTTATPSKPTTPTRPITPSMEVIKERAAIKIQRATRKWLERNRQRVLARDAAYRERIVKEITETEEQYLDRMNYLKTVVLKDLRDAVNKGSPIISIEEIQTIFSEVEIIEAYNQKFLHDFKTRTANFKKDTMIGDIFIKFSQFLKIYSQYSRNYSEAMNALNECKKQSKFKSYLEKVKHDRPEIGLRGLEDYLIRPVQRIPRYSLLLKDMISHTWKSHPDYAQLEEAFQKMNSVAEYMNEKKKEAENMMKLAEIQEKLDGESSAVLAKSFRKFVKEGDFVEVLTKGKKAPIVIYLFNDSLAITRPTKSSGSSFFSKQKTIRLQFEQIFLLHQLTMKEYESVCGVANSLKLQSKKDSQISIVVATHDRDTLDEWIKAINAEKAEDEKNVKEQNDRISSSINEKVIATKQKIEEKFTRVSGQYSASDVESIGGRSDSSSTGSLSNSTDSTGESGGVPADLKSGKMSLRERRVRLAQESKNKRLSGHMAAMNSSTDLNDLK